MTTFDPANLDSTKIYKFSTIAQFLDTPTNSLLTFLKNSKILHSCWEKRNMPTEKYKHWFKTERNEQNEIVLYLTACGTKKLFLFLLDSGITLSYGRADMLGKQLT